MEVRAITSNIFFHLISNEISSKFFTAIAPPLLLIKLFVTRFLIHILSLYPPLFLSSWYHSCYDHIEHIILLLHLEQNLISVEPADDHIMFMFDQHIHFPPCYDHITCNITMTFKTITYKPAIIAIAATTCIVTSHRSLLLIQTYNVTIAFKTVTYNL